MQVNQSTQRPQASTDADSGDDAIASIPSAADAPRDYRELAIEELTFSIRSTERSRDSYRELLMVALTQLHVLSAANRALRASVRHLLERARRNPVDAERRDVA